MGFKLAGVFFILMLAMAGLGYWYYNDTQGTIATLRENNAKLEVAIQVSEESIKMLQEDAAKIAEANLQLQQDLQKAEQYGDELQNKLRRHDLTALALRKPGLLEGKMNGATANLWRELEQDTGGAGDSPLPYWLQSESVQDGSGTESASSDKGREDNSSDSSSPETSSAN